jgi:hypothetical protein
VLINVHKSIYLLLNYEVFVFFARFMSYKARVPPRAIPAMAMTVVRNGNCSTGAVAPDLAEDEEVAVAAEPEAAVPEVAADEEAWVSGQLPTNDVAKKGREDKIPLLVLPQLLCCS